MASLGKQFFRHVLPAVLKPARVLWNEVIGFVFLALAVWSAPSAYRNLRELDGDADSIFRAMLSIVFALLMTGFGVFSFVRARRISRS